MEDRETSPVLITTHTKPRRRIYVLRWAQMICSLLCIILAGILFPREKYYVVWIIVVLAVSSAFWFITTIDVISWLLKERIRFKSWLMIAVAGFLMNCFSAGLMFATDKGSKVLIITLAVTCLVTGILFLLDTLWISNRTISKSSGRYSRKSTVKPYPHAYGDSVDRAVSVCFLFDVNEYESPKTKRRYGIPVKPPRRDVTPSYGGTFPVSKEFVPLPSPDSKGPDAEQRRSIFAHVPSRPSRRVPISPSRRASTSPSRYDDDNGPVRPGEDQYQGTRVSTVSYAPGRRAPMDTVPERDSSVRKRRGYFDDDPPDFSGRKMSVWSQTGRAEQDQLERDHRGQRNARAGLLDTVPERDDSSRASDRESRRRYGDEQPRHGRY